MTTERLHVDVRGERQAAGLLLLAALAALISGVWLAIVAESLVPRAFALAACVFGVLWGRRLLRQRARLDVAPVRYLEIGEEHLAQVEGDTTQSIPLTSIRSVEIDHDRLLVVLQREGAEPWLLEPRYQGVGLEELAQRVHEAVLVARTRASS